ncbi:MAG: hypothetical protein A2Y33_16295 [Spirochaetes bacterium GWF1_51_8]|nr:MAG: hypothetical protein A2Y33_16295 [Spirochaetes bacterium GWF1_51_8]
MTVETHPFTLSQEESIEGTADVIHPWRNNTKKDDAWIVNNKYFGYLPNRDIKYLIIGTFPPLDVIINRRRNIPFFYGGEQNEFWNLLEKLTNYSFNFNSINGNYLSFFNRYGIGITDILYKTERIEPDYRDKNLNPILKNNILCLLKDFSKIERIYFTSGGPMIVKINRNNLKSAFGWFYECFTEEKIDISNKILNFENRLIKIHILYSPSRSANGGISRIYRGKPFEESLCNFLSKMIQFHDYNTPQKIKMLQWMKHISKIENLKMDLSSLDKFEKYYPSIIK